MIKFILLSYTRSIFIILLLAVLFSLSGCTTFGTFSSLKQGQSTNEDVRELLGEPEEIRSEETQDIWKYTFAKPLKVQKTLNSYKTLETEIIFQNGLMTDYQITVVTKTIPQKMGPEPGQGNTGPIINNNTGPIINNSSQTGRAQPGIQGLDPKARKFLEKFDVNRDNRITRKEYFGSQELFNRIDTNNNNIIEIIELKHFSVKK